MAKKTKRRYGKMDRKTFLMATIITVLTLSVVPAFAAKKSAITLEEAVKIAREHAPGELIKVERERGLYEVKLLTQEGKRVELYIDAETGKVVHDKAKGISFDEAVATAKKATPGEVIKAEYERGRYEIKIRQDDGSLTELYIDASTGEITKSEQTRDYYNDDEDDD